MAKAIIVIFFILGFIIFYFIKFAVKGVKNAYTAVNANERGARQLAESSSTDSEVGKIVDIISTTLSVQRSLIADEYNILPENAKDEWSLGYVAGYSDAILQRKGIKPDVTGFSIVTIVFMTMFGREHGPLYLRKFMDLQQSRDEELLSGMQTGGEEVFAWLRDTSKVPMGWLGHARRSQQ